jgi:hypothetical protein
MRARPDLPIRMRVSHLPREIAHCVVGAGLPSALFQLTAG